MLPLRSHDIGRPISYVHDQLSAAVWRFPFCKWRRGYPGVTRVTPVWKLRKVVKVLAAGGTCRQAAHRAKVSLTRVIELKRAVMAWKDPDDER